MYVKPRMKQHCKAISTQLLDKQANLSAQERHLIYSGRIDPQELEYLVPQSVVGAPQDPDEAHLIFKKHHSVNDTYLSQIIWNWVENTRQQSPSWEATADQLQDWKDGVSGGPTCQNFLYFFDQKPTLDYNWRAIHVLSTSLQEALEKGEYPTDHLEKIPTIHQLSKTISEHMRHLSKRYQDMKVPRTSEELNETQAQGRGESR